MEKRMRDYQDSILAEVRKYHKLKDAEAELYYQQAISFAAVAPFYPKKGCDSDFKGSAAYTGWLKRNAAAIEEIKDGYKRFSFCGV